MVKIATMVSVIVVFIGGALFGSGAYGLALAITALGAGWNGIMFASVEERAK